jgi:hypothetical protein
MITANASFEGMDVYVSELSGVRFGGHPAWQEGQQFTLTLTASVFEMLPLSTLW